MTTGPTKPTAHVAISYTVCLAAAALAIVGVQYVTHNAVNQTIAGLVIPVLAQALAYAMQATGQVSIVGEIAPMDATAGVTALASALLPQLTPAMQQVVRSEMTALLAPAPAAETEAGPAPEASPAPPATTASPAAVGQ